MNNEQNLKDKSVDNHQNQLGFFAFDIRQDLGTCYTPGEMVSRKEYSILYCLCNSGAEFQVEGTKYLLERGDILVIKPDIPHGILTYGKPWGEYAGYLVSIGQRHVEAMLQYKEFQKVKGDYIRIRTRGTLWEPLESLFIMACKEMELKLPGWETALFGYAVVLMVQLGRAAVSDPNEVGKTDKSDLLNSILAYIEANISERLTLDAVASKFYISESTLTQLFRSKMNTSFYKYVLNCRMWMAKNLIAEGMAMEKVAARKIKIKKKNLPWGKVSKSASSPHELALSLLKNFVATEIFHTLLGMPFLRRRSSSRSASSMGRSL